MSLRWIAGLVATILTCCSISANAQFIPVPIYSDSASLLEFSADIGQTDFEILTITNIGTDNLVINSISFSNPHFARSSSSTLVAGAGLLPGGSATLMITFTPDAPGEEFGFVFIGHSAVPSDTGAQLHGVGIAAAVPEPSTWAMLLIGFAGVGFLTYRRRNQMAAIAA